MSERTLRYEILFGDRVAGSVVLVRRADGSSDEDLELVERGKRPKLHTRLELDAEGLPKRLELSGKNMRAEQVREVFQCETGACRWESKSERGTGPRGFYVPLNVSLSVNAPALRYALAHGSARLLPGGELRAREVRRTKLDADDGSGGVEVRAFELAGFGFSPRIEWFDSDGESFAQVDDTGAGIRAGFRKSIATLRELQRPFAIARREDIAKSVAHGVEKLAVVHARLFDSKRKRASDDATILIEAGKVKRIGAKLEPPAGYEVIDAKGKLVTPGLWDMHVHLTDDDGLMHVANGITTVRDLGSEVDAALLRKSRWDQGKELGPHVVLAGFVDGRGPVQGPFKLFADTPEEAESVVKAYADKGYVQLKIYSSVKPALVPVLVRAAKARGLRVSGHIPQGMSSEDVVRAGFDEIQHIEYVIYDLHAKPEDERRRTALLGQRGADVDLDSKKSKALVDALVKHKTVVDPTLNVIEAELTVRADHPNPTLAPLLGRLPNQVEREATEGALPVPPGMDERYVKAFRRSAELVKRLWDRNVPLVAGSDAWTGFALHRELELYAELGIPNADVLSIATLGAARVMKMDGRTGSLEPGKDADLVIFDGDPLTRMSDVRKAVLVVKGTSVIDAVRARSALSIAPQD